jgi:hypothetical protein
MYSRTQNPIEDKITLWTSITPLERTRAVRWFASRPTPEQTSIISEGEQTVLPNLQKANPEYVEDSALRYAAFLLAIRHGGYDLARKRGGRAMRDSAFEKLEAMRKGVMENLRSRKKSPLRFCLLSYWGEIKSLKQDGSGFLLISRYLARMHNIKVSPSYLAKLWLEVEG